MEIVSALFEKINKNQNDCTEIRDEFTVANDYFEVQMTIWFELCEPESNRISLEIMKRKKILTKNKTDF